MKSVSIDAKTLLKRSLLSAVSITVAVTLPWLCHLLGGAMGLGSGLGEMLLPMHLPVMLAGLLWGYQVGFVAGLVSPLASFALTGMPGAMMLPFITVELAVYGLTAGLLSRMKMPTLGKVVLVQVAGRAVRALALAVAIYGFGFAGLPMSIVWTSITAGAVGILLQWVLVPVLCRQAKR